MKPKLTIPILCLVSAVTIACSSGGDSSPGPPAGLQANFTGGNTSPGDMTLSMAAGAASEDDFNVRVLVTGVDAFFGAAFRVEFDPSLVRFAGFDSSGSFIGGAGVATDFRAELDSGDPGALLVNATRQGQMAGVDATGSELLLVLSFEAVAAGGTPSR